MKIQLSLTLFFVALVALLLPRAARADLGYWSAALVGTWKHPQTGDIYHFNSNATYIMTFAKLGEHRRVATSGYWKIVQPTEKESGGSLEGPVALLIKQRKVTFVEEDGLRHSENLKMERRLVVDTVKTEKGSNRNLYHIDGVNWKRVK